MAEALALAAKGAGQTSPNPTVGAIVVRDGYVMGRGYHVYAQMSVTPKWKLLSRPDEQARGATIYVTLEPCAIRVAHALRRGIDRSRCCACGGRDGRSQSGRVGRGFARLRGCRYQVDIDTDATA